MSFGILISSSNYNGQLGDITYYPDTGGTVSIGVQTIPYTYNADYYYGSYEIYFSGSEKTCYAYMDNPFTNFLLQENYSLILQEDNSGILTEGTVSVELTGEYSPGSVNIQYVATSNLTLYSDVEISFVDTLETISGAPLVISGTVLINSGNTVGTSYYSVAENYNNLSKVANFTNVTYSVTGQSVTVLVETNSEFDVTPTPTTTPTVTPTPTNTPTNTVSPTVTPTPSVTPVIGAPILLLDGANATSSTWTDTSGQGNNVTLYNSPTISTDNGGYVSLNGTNQYGTAPSGFDDFTNGITVLAFVDFNGVSNWERIIDFGNGEASDNILLNRESNTNNLWFEIRQGSTQTFAYSLTNGITNNNWGFYGARLNGSTYKVFTQSTSDVGSTSVLPNNITRSSNLIGDSNWTADAFFDGKMGVIAIYDYALTDSEINSFYEYYKDRYSLSPLPYVTPTPTVTATNTVTPTLTPTVTPTNTTTPTVTPTNTQTPTVTPSITVSTTPSITPSISVSTTPSITVSISATPSVTPTISTSPSPTVESFTSVGTTSWTAPAGVTSVEYLVVGGGGGGGNGYDTGAGGGGGGGMVLTGTLSVTPGNSYTVTVGSGGVGGAGTRANNNGTAGDDSVFATITSLGGDFGNASRTVQIAVGTGGSAQVSNTTAPTGGDGGGNSGTAVGGSGGGGGGATGNGGNGSASAGGTSGDGVTSSITGVSIQYGRGGNGARGNVATTGANGLANRGTGGGGGGCSSACGRAGGNGGSGIVVLKYFA